MAKHKILNTYRYGHRLATPPLRKKKVKSPGKQSVICYPIKFTFHFNTKSVIKLYIQNCLYCDEKKKKNNKVEHLPSFPKFTTNITPYL